MEKLDLIFIRRKLALQVSGSLGALLGTAGYMKKQ